MKPAELNEINLQVEQFKVITSVGLNIAMVVCLRLQVLPCPWKWTAVQRPFKVKGDLQYTQAADFWPLYMPKM